MDGQQILGVLLIVVPTVTVLLAAFLWDWEATLFALAMTVAAFAFVGVVFYGIHLLIGEA